MAGPSAVDIDTGGEPPAVWMARGTKLSRALELGSLLVSRNVDLNHVLAFRHAFGASHDVILKAANQRPSGSR